MSVSYDPPPLNRPYFAAGSHRGGVTRKHADAHDWLVIGGGLVRDGHSYSSVCRVSRKSLKMWWTHLGSNQGPAD